MAVILPADQYNAFEGEGENDPYSNIRKMLSMKSPASGAPGGMGSPEAPAAGVTSPSSYGSMPTSGMYANAASPNPVNFPTPGVTNPPVGTFGNNTSSIQGALGGVAGDSSSAQNSLINSTSGIEDFLSGPPTSSPLYTSLLNNARSSISNSYDQAVANTRSNAESRGFGYESPVEQGAESGVRSQEAGALSAAPSAALQETISPELQAAQLATTQAGQYGAENIASLGDISALQQSRNSKTASMFSSLMQMIDAMISGGSQAGAADLSHA